MIVGDGPEFKKIKKNNRIKFRKKVKMFGFYQKKS